MSISSTDTIELLGRAQRAERLRADIIELRLDKLRSHHGLGKVVQAVKTPIIATNRSLSERGSFDRSEAERLRILLDAIDEGSQYVDLELATEKLDGAMADFRGKGAKIILSHHDYLRTPDLSKLQSTLGRLQKHKPDLCKIVTTARQPEDNLRILSLLNENCRNTAMIGFAMGSIGVWSRIMAPFCGAAFTYASLDRGLETAPGQPSVADLRHIYDTLGLE